MSNSLVTGIYECLRERLLLGCYPPGTHLDYKRISCELHVSTTPMREAVGRLAGDGLVEMIPRLGAQISRFEPDELVWLYEVREALELHALRLATQRLTAARLVTMEQLVERMQRLAMEAQEASVTATCRRNCAEFRKLDWAFHMNIIAAAGNQQLTRIAENVLLLTWLARGKWLGGGDQAKIQSNAAHKAICEALRTRNEERVVQACRRHLKHDLELTIGGQESQPDTSRFSEGGVRLLKSPRAALKSRPQCTAPQNEFHAVV